MRRLIITLLLSLFATLTLADPRLYQVNVLIYSHLSAVGLNSEQWPFVKPPKLDLNNLYQLKPFSNLKANLPDQSLNYSLLSNDDFRMQRALNKLENNPDYQVMLHLAWQQPMDSPHQAKWVHIYGGKGYDNAGNVVANNSTGQLAYADAEHWQVDGLVRLDVQRYINSRYRLTFATPLTQIRHLSDNKNFDQYNQALVYFKLKQSRRMRSGELNYVGHPLYGILIDIERVPNKT